MGLREDLITQAKEKIALLKEDCKSASIADLEKAVSCIEGICVEAQDGKDSFDEAQKILDAIEADCPDSKKLLDELRDMFLQGSGIKCGGG